MRKLSTLLYTLTIFGLALSIYSIYSLSITPFTMIFKLQSDTSIYFSDLFSPFKLRFLTDQITVCELLEKPIFSQTNSSITNFTISLDFDPFTNFQQHISDFQAYQSLKFKSLQCQCEKGECYEFEYLKFQIQQKQSYFDIQQIITEKTFTIALNRKREGDIAPIELTTGLSEFASSYLQVVNSANENFRMRCQLDVEVRQIQFDLRSGNSCKTMTQNSFSGVVKPPVWVQAGNGANSVLGEIESVEELKYKKQGKQQILLLVGLTFACFLLSAFSYLRNSQTEIDLDDM